jgi:DNA recombination protein RmuC
MAIPELVVGLLTGGCVSGLLAWLWTERRHRAGVVSTLSQLALTDQRADDLIDRVASLEAQLKRAEEQRLGLATERATLLAQLDAERSRLADQSRFIEQAEERLRETFAALSAESLQKGNRQFLDLATQRFGELTTRAATGLDQKRLEMQNLLQPVAQTLELYRSELAKLETARGEAYRTLTGELAKVASTQELLNRETRQLGHALRRSEVRGQWGELTLRRLLELSGLASRVTFREQVSIDTDAGKRRPDCVIDLPSDRQVLIDCKAVLDAFLNAMNESEEVKRVEFLKQHAQQIRTTVKSLAAKRYWDEFGQSADFVVLFLPGEAFLYAAVEQDPRLIEDALACNVIIASPTTLLGLLKVIEHGWDQRRIEANAQKIREIGVELHSRLTTMADHFARLGGALEGSMKAYNDTLGSLETSVFRQTRKLAELGAEGKKPLSEVEMLEVSRRELGTLATVSRTSGERGELFDRERDERTDAHSVRG